MNKNSDAPAYPVEDSIYTGLTKRELIAAMVLQGLVSSGEVWQVNSAETLAKESVKLSDALLKELEK